MFTKIKKFYKAGDIEIIFCTKGDFKKKYNVRNYERNRDPDLSRIEKISNVYKNNNTLLVPGIICCWLKNNSIYIYDGIHRFTAALDDMKIIVKILTSDDEVVVINDFRNINSGVNLPMLYLEEDNEYKRQVCETIMNKMCNKYEACVSSSRNPQRQNFNRDVFIESILSRLNIDYSKKDVSEGVWQAILGLNSKAKLHVLENKIPHPKKCEFNNFYLMYLGIDYIKKSIENSHLVLT